MVLTCISQDHTGLITVLALAENGRKYFSCYHPTTGNDVAAAANLIDRRKLNDSVMIARSIASLLKPMEIPTDVRSAMKGAYDSLGLSKVNIFFNEGLAYIKN